MTQTLEFDTLHNELHEKTQRSLRRISGMAAIPDDAVAIEVGSWVGQSACILSENFSQIFCVDHFRGNQSDKLGKIVEDIGRLTVFRTFCKNLGPRLFHQIVPLVGDSLTWAEQFRKSGFKADFVYIDADHGYESVLNDIQAWLPVVKHGGIIAGHDFSQAFPSVIEAVEAVFGRDVLVDDEIWHKRVE